LIRVQATSSEKGWLCQVSVEAGGRRSEYTVRVSAAELGRWGRGSDQVAVEDLVTRSFEFLLEREPPSSILRSFDLSAIQRYFPEYDQAIRK
jgi:hypothetical protein